MKKNLRFFLHKISKIGTLEVFFILATILASADDILVSKENFPNYVLIFCYACIMSVVLRILEMRRAGHVIIVRKWKNILSEKISVLCTRGEGRLHARIGLPILALIGLHCRIRCRISIRIGELLLRWHLEL